MQHRKTRIARGNFEIGAPKVRVVRDQGIDVDLWPLIGRDIDVDSFGLSFKFLPPCFNTRKLRPAVQLFGDKLNELPACLPCCCQLIGRLGWWCLRSKDRCAEADQKSRNYSETKVH